MNTGMPIGVDDKKGSGTLLLCGQDRFYSTTIDNHSDVTLITRPRRFGKTLTMSMLEYFFSIDHKEKSIGLFSGLTVEKRGKAYMKYELPPNVRPKNLTIGGQFFYGANLQYRACEKISVNIDLL